MVLVRSAIQRRENVSDLSVLVGRIVEPPGCEASSSIQVIAPKIHRILLFASKHKLDWFEDIHRFVT